MNEHELSLRTLMNDDKRILDFCEMLESIIRDADSINVDLCILLYEILKLHFGRE
jgi:hypothetical protein